MTPAQAQMQRQREESDKLLAAGFAKTSADMVTVTTDFVADMQQLLSPERVAAIWAGKPDPWEQGQ